MKNKHIFNEPNFPMYVSRLISLILEFVFHSNPRVVNSHNDILFKFRIIFKVIWLRIITPR